MNLKYDTILFQLALMAAYRKWSEDTYAAGFMTPDEGSMKEFARHMGSLLTAREIGLEDYEHDMLDKFGAILRKETPS